MFHTDTQAHTRAHWIDIRPRVATIKCINVGLKIKRTQSTYQSFIFYTNKLYSSVCCVLCVRCTHMLDACEFIFIRFVPLYVCLFIYLFICLFGFVFGICMLPPQYFILPTLKPKMCSRRFWLYQPHQFNFLFKCILVFLFFFVLVFVVYFHINYENLDAKLIFGVLQSLRIVKERQVCW